MIDWIMLSSILFGIIMLLYIMGILRVISKKLSDVFFMTAIFYLIISVIYRIGTSGINPIIKEHYILLTWTLFALEYLDIFSTIRFIKRDRSSKAEINTWARFVFNKVGRNWGAGTILIIFNIAIVFLVFSSLSSADSILIGILFYTGMKILVSISNFSYYDNKFRSKNE